MKFLFILIICAFSLQAKDQLKSKIKTQEHPTIATIREKYFGQKRYFLNTSDYQQVELIIFFYPCFFIMLGEYFFH